MGSRTAGAARIGASIIGLDMALIGAVQSPVFQVLVAGGGGIVADRGMAVWSCCGGPDCAWGALCGSSEKRVTAIAAPPETVRVP